MRKILILILFIFLIISVSNCGMAESGSAEENSRDNSTTESSSLSKVSATSDKIVTSANFADFTSDKELISSLKDQEESEGNSVNDSESLMYGDVNNNGVVSLLDAILTARHYVGLEVEDFNAEAADVDGNGTVDIVDGLFIAQFAEGIIDGFPVNSTHIRNKNIESYIESMNISLIKEYKYGSNMARDVNIKVKVKDQYKNMVSRIRVYLQDEKNMCDPMVGQSGFEAFYGKDLIYNETTGFYEADIEKVQIYGVLNIDDDDSLPWYIGECYLYNDKDEMIQGLYVENNENWNYLQYEKGREYYSPFIIDNVEERMIPERCYLVTGATKEEYDVMMYNISDLNYSTITF